MLIWWWGAIILGGMLTESPPSSQRLITSAPPAVFFVALALWKIAQIVQRLVRRPAPRPRSAQQAPPAWRRYAWGRPSWRCCNSSVNGIFVNTHPCASTATTPPPADALVHYAEKLDPPSRYLMVFFGVPDVRRFWLGQVHCAGDRRAGHSEPCSAVRSQDFARRQTTHLCLHALPLQRNSFLQHVERARGNDLSRAGATEPLLPVYRPASGWGEHARAVRFDRDVPGATLPELRPAWRSPGRR
jgi:hypothetical protein